MTLPGETEKQSAVLTEETSEEMFPSLDYS